MWISYFWIPNREVDNRHTISSLHQRLSSILCQYHQCHPEEQYRVPQAGGRIRTQPPLLHARPCYCRDALRCSRQQTARHTEYLRAQTADRRYGIFPRTRLCKAGYLRQQRLRQHEHHDAQRHKAVGLRYDLRCLPAIR